MNRELPPQGCHLYKTLTSPNAHALLIHDLAEVRPSAVDLLAQALGSINVQLLACSLRNIHQPITVADLQALYQWQSGHFYKPQIGIGIGLGARLQHLLDWPDAWAMVHINAADVRRFATASDRDLFSSPQINVAAGSVQVAPATANMVLQQAESIAAQADTPQLWLGTAEQLAELSLPVSASRLQVPHDLAAEGLMYVRLISAWIQGQTVRGDASAWMDANTAHQLHCLPGGQHQAQAQMSAGEQIELRTGELSFACAATEDTAVNLLLLAIAHASLLELRQIIQRLGWKTPRVHMSIRSAGLLQESKEPRAEEQQQNTGQQLCHIREIHIQEGMDEVRKNLLHQQLRDSISLGGATIALINRLR